jgi:N-acetylmuramoyl-L-alanine amidase
MTTTPHSGRRRRGAPPDITRRYFLQSAAGASLLVAVALNIVAVLLLWRWWETGPTEVVAAPSVEHLVALTVSPPVPTARIEARLPPAYTPQPVPTPTPAPEPTATLAPTPTANPADTRRRVGIIAGHSQNDSGAVCEDTGLQEVQVTEEVARLLAERLTHAGLHVDVLAEFDPALTLYKANVLVSIHVDSCLDWEGLTGFKVARSSQSLIPETEDLLVACLNERYGDVTGLPRHDTSITPNMTSYHAFRKIASDTPAAIIELGFLYKDRPILTGGRARLARGLSESILCFLDTQK